MSIETPWANDLAGGTKLNATRLNSYTPIRGTFTNPNGNVTGSPGNTYLNTAGGASVTLWIKETGIGTNTGWVAPTPSSGSAGHTIKDEGTALTARAGLNFVGSGVTATDDSANNQTIVTIPGVTSTAHTIQDEGTPLTARTGLNFVGSGVTATDDVANNRTTVTIPGGSSSAGIDPAILTAKGDIISASAASTPSVLHQPGTNGRVLTTNLSTTPGLAWQIPSYNTIKTAGTALPQQPTLNIIGATVVDNAGQSQTDITITSGGGSQTWATPALDTSNSTSYVAQIPATSGQYLINLDRNYVIGILDGTTTQFFEVHLCLIQDTTGGRIVTFPGSIHWHGTPIDGLGQPQLSAEPLSITYMKLIWLGTAGGFLGLAG